MFPLCLAKTLDFLKYPSMLGVLSMVYMMGVLVADYAMYGPKNDAVIDKKYVTLVVFIFFQYCPFLSISISGRVHNPG